MFINATSQLYDLLTFKQGLVTGSLYLVVLGLVMGVAAALIYLLPSNVRRPSCMRLVGVVAFGLLQDLITRHAVELGCADASDSVPLRNRMVCPSRVR